MTKPTNKRTDSAPSKKKGGGTKGKGTRTYGYNPAANASRKEVNRAAARESLRMKLSGSRYITEIEKNYKELVELNEHIGRLKSPSPTAKKNVAQARQAKNQLELEKAETRHRVIKTKIDTNFRRLAKVLPDLKAVEIGGPDGENPLAAIAEAMRAVVLDRQGNVTGVKGSNDE